MYERIVLATDGSEGADAAADHAIDLAARDGATLHVLHVVDVSPLPLDSHSGALLSMLEEVGEEAVETVARRARDGGVDEVEAVVLQGVSHRKIVEYANANDTELLVLGTHGRTGLDRVLLGSVAGRVVRTAGVPVLVIPPKPAANGAE